MAESRQGAIVDAGGAGTRSSSLGMVGRTARRRARRVCSAYLKNHRDRARICGSDCEGDLGSAQVHAPGGSTLATIPDSFMPAILIIAMALALLPDIAFRQ